MTHAQVLTVASLQRLKIGALIAAPADFEVRSVIKVFNTQTLAPTEIHVNSTSSNFPLLVAQNCHGEPVVQKMVRQLGAKGADTRTQCKAHGISIHILWSIFLTLQEIAVRFAFSEYS